jgi:hypothetical protein
MQGSGIKRRGWGAQLMMVQHGRGTKWRMAKAHKHVTMALLSVKILVLQMISPFGHPQ